MKIFFTAIIIFLSINTFAQVAVRDEPRHHNVFENDYVRILDVHLKPADTTQIHIHATPSVFNTYTKTITVQQSVGKAGVRNTSTAGSMSYDSLATPRTHRVWNEDTDWYHVMDVELTSKVPRVTEAVLQNKFLSLLFDAERARGYRVTLDANSELQLPAGKIGYLLLSLGNADITINNEHRLMNRSHFAWFDKGKEVVIKNNSNATVLFNLLQLM